MAYVDFKKDINDYFENLAVTYFNNYANNNQKYSYKLNNNKFSKDTDIDIALISNGYKISEIDVQYTTNFSKYGDVRIDLMSCGYLKQNFSKMNVKSLNNFLYYNKNIETFKDMFSIKKVGKYFQKSENNLFNGVFYFVFDDNVQKDLNTIKATNVNGFFFIPYRIILEEVRNNNNLIIKVNDKKANNLNDDFHSAFICLNAKKLLDKYELPFFNNLNDLELKLNDVIKSETELFLIEKSKKEKEEKQSNSKSMKQ